MSSFKIFLIMTWVAFVRLVNFIVGIYVIPMMLIYAGSLMVKSIYNSNKYGSERAMEMAREEGAITISDYGHRKYIDYVLCTIIWYVLYKLIFR